MESVGGSATSMSFSAVVDVFPVEPTVVLVGVEKKDITQSTKFQENALWGVGEEDSGTRTSRAAIVGT